MSPAPISLAKVYQGEEEVLGYHCFNTGVIVMKKSDSVVALLHKWYEIYRDRFGKYQNDQPAFMEALLHRPVTICPLQPTYNCRVHCLVTLPPHRKVKIIHGRPRNYQSVFKKLNRSQKQRTWLPTGKVITRPQPLHVWMDRNLPKWIRNLLKWTLVDRWRNAPSGESQDQPYAQGSLDADLIQNKHQ